MDQSIPWYIWCSVAAVTSAMIGTHWDIAWHRSIGRDSFWTPAHVAIYFCGVLAGLSCGFLILNTTFRKTKEAWKCSVSIWGFRGPLGAFIAAWGGLAMITSAPFDNWWHGAYGLDVKILSPPHVLLILGIIGVQLGALILILGEMNRAAGERRSKLMALFLYVGAVVLVMQLVLFMEHTFRSYMHGARFYRTLALSVPLVLAGLAHASGKRWAATTVAGLYTVILLGFLWILPLFPAEPKLGPVYREVKTFIPPEFPLAIVLPALAIDLVRRKMNDAGKWRQALAAGPAFLLVLVAAQWPLADLLLSPLARNAVLGSIYFDYNIPSTSYYVRHLYYPTESTPLEFWLNMGLALVFAVLSTRVGLGWGDWMRRIRR
ncbi:MAG: hypothetical protein WD696_11820 [Bryobacteraceae bacterium]